MRKEEKMRDMKEKSKWKLLRTRIREKGYNRVMKKDY